MLGSLLEGRGRAARPGACVYLSCCHRVFDQIYSAIIDQSGRPLELNFVPSRGMMGYYG